MQGIRFYPKVNGPRKNNDVYFILLIEALRKITIISLFESGGI